MNIDHTASSLSRDVEHMLREWLRVSRFLRNVTFVLIVVLALPAFAQNGADVFGLERGEHAVGFRLLEDEDRSRAVTGGARGAAHARLIRTYMWYPAARSRRSQPLRFRRYAELADDDVWPTSISGAIHERLKYANGPLARVLPAATYAALVERPMRAVENAAPLAGPFPLIVIGLGLYYESPVTFAATAEYLAGHGFVVATAPLVGTHVAIVKLDGQDLETQVRDLEFVIARARQFPFVDAERLGVLGFDMGGMAGLVLAMRNRDVDTFVSLDSGIQVPHPSGLPRASTHYDALALRVPWLHIANPRNDQLPSGAGAKPLFEEAVHSDRYWLKTVALGHADYTSYALVEGRGAAANYWEPVTPARTAAHRAVADYVLQFFTAQLKAGSTVFLERDVRQVLGDTSATLEHRSAAAAPVGYDELVRKIVGGQADEAITELRLLATTAPNDALLTEFNLGRLCTSLLFTWNLAEQILPLVEFTLERYPSSPNAKMMLGEAEAILGNTPAAIAAFEQLLERFPGNPAIQSRIEELRKRR
jgi:dienelactone hydrolase